MVNTEFKSPDNSYLEFLENLDSKYFNTLCKLCGNTHRVRKDHFLKGNVVSCGCLSRLKPKGRDYTGQEVNGIGFYGYIGKGWYKVKFRCGHSGEIKPYSAHKNRTGKCHKCAIKEVLEHRNTSHGLSKTRTYNIWCMMKARCTYEKGNRYENYGGRGISYDPRWELFENFLEDMGEAPENMSLNRIDNDKNYCKENCEWASDIVQANNKTNNILICDSQGTVWSLKRWCEILGKDYKKTFSRFRYEGISIRNLLGDEYSLVDRSSTT